MCSIELARQYYAVFDFIPFGDRIWTSLASVLQALPSSLSCATRPSALLKLIHALVQQPETLPVVAEHMETVKQCIRCIGSKCDPNVSKIVIDIVMSLLDWNDGVFIHPHVQVVCILLNPCPNLFANSYFHVL